MGKNQLVTGMRIIAAILALWAAAVSAEPAAWRVPGENGGQVVLLGSVHTLRESDYPLPDSVDGLYSSADTIVMELDLDDLDAATIQAELLGAALLPTPTRLEDVLSPALYAAANQRARTLGLDLILLERFEPWLVAITMLELGLGQLGYQPHLGIEQYLLGSAQRDGKEVLGLESLAAQTGVFDGLTFDQQTALLEQTLTELDSAENVMNEMITAWRSGELDELATSLLAQFEEFPELYDSLVVARNEAWIVEIEKFLASTTSYLVVVGGLHLVGPDSVIELLEDRGHPVERLMH
jgi:uncharacterized protein YbaP (TraB family)